MGKLPSSTVVNIGDLRRIAQRRIPRVVFDYIDGGADGEVTLRENCRAFDRVTFPPRHAVALPACDLRTKVLGAELSLPAMLAPVGYSRLMHPTGEPAAARAAGAAGTGYILSTLSGHKLEDVGAASSGPVWYQLYLVGGREVAEASIARARAAGFSALVVTIDTAVSGLRERDLRNGMIELMSGSIFAKIPFLPQLLSHPGWLVSFLAYGLAAAGEAGVTRALQILRSDMERTLKLLGCTSVAKLDRSYVTAPVDHCLAQKSY